MTPARPRAYPAIRAGARGGPAPARPRVQSDTGRIALICPVPELVK